MEPAKTKRGFGAVEAIVSIVIYLIMMIVLQQTYNASSSNFTGIVKTIMDNLPVLSAVGGIVMTAALFGLIRR